MGVRKRTYYTIECNHCGKLLEDDAGELAGLTIKREQAIKTAEQYGWFCIGKDTWRCIDCNKVINLSEDKQAEFIKMVSAHILNEYNMVNHRIATLTDELKTNQKRLAERQSAEKPRKSLINYSKARVDTIEKELSELQDRLKILSLMTTGNTLNTHHIKLKRVASRKNITTLKADFIFEKENATVTHCIATYSLHDKKLCVEYTDKTPADF